LSAAAILLAVLLAFQTADDWYAAGVRQAAAGKTSEAVEAYRRAVELNPAHADAWNNLGDLLRRIGNRPAALDAVRHALSANPDHPRAALNAAMLQLELKNPTAALAFLTIARKAMGDLPALDYLAARAHLESDDYVSAQPYLTRFRRAAGSSLAASLELATLLVEHKQAAAAAELLLAVPDDKRDAEMQLRLGQAWYALDRLEAARNTFTKFVESAPDDFRGHLWRGYAERGLGDSEAAEAEWQKALALKADVPDALVALADLELDRGRTSDALAYAERALKLRPDVPAALLVNGLALFRLGRASDAAAVLARIPANSGEYARSLYPLSRAYRQFGQIEKADAALREFQALDADENKIDATPGRKRP
jgi:tetratricopeptide (TPR) repeat protein